MNDETEHSARATGPPMGYDGHAKYRSAEASRYDAERANEALWRFENAFVERYFATHSPDVLLDAPVGTGRFLHCYAPRSKVIGLDVSRAMLEQAAHKLAAIRHPNTTLVEGDIFRLVFANATFDAIVCWRLLHLMPEGNLVPALAELRRVLRGDLIAQVYLQGGPLRRLASRAARLVGRAVGLTSAMPELRSDEHIRSYIHPRATMEAAIARTGLRIHESRALGHYFGHEVRVYVLRCQ